MCLLRSRVRSPSSAGWAPCRERPGRSGGEEPADLSHVRRRESPGGEALTAVYQHRVSAGPMTAPTRFRTGVLGGRIDSYIDIHRHQACRRRRRFACSPQPDWAWERRTDDDSRPRSDGLADSQPASGADQSERQSV
jgi:hypothetical protein